MDPHDARCNTSGQIGDGTTTHRSTPAVVAGLANVVSIAAGASLTCAALCDGTVRWWGSNARGQLGDGTTMSRTTPAVVPALTRVTCC